MQRTREEIAEIERHKYLLSEKMGYDVGWEFAQQDWEENYADSWKGTSGSNHENIEAAVSLPEETSVATAEPATQSATTHSNAESPVGPFKRFLNRVFART